MTTGNLFSGIGGFELAAIKAGLTPVWSNEIDSYCCQVLRKNFTHQIIEDDIRNIGKGRKTELPAVDIISGGFPCQPFSMAGQRKGAEDDRYLWPEMLRIIREVQPRWIVGENVTGILSMDDGRVFEEICNSLESENYSVQSFIIPACAKGAPHKRNRVWIIAKSNRPHEGGASRRLQRTNQGEGLQEEQPMDIACGASEIHAIAANSSIENDGRYIREQEERQKQEFRNGIAFKSIADANIQRSQTRRICSFEKRQNGSAFVEPWQQSWFEVATRLCRVDDGLPAWVDSHRTKRIKALGNAIVPQIAEEIFKAIKQVSH